jgi:hypothetical protein
MCLNCRNAYPIYVSAVFDPFLPGFVVKKQGVKAMSISQLTTCNGKVVSNISLTEPSPTPGGKKEYEVRIKFNNGTGLNLKSESIITFEEVIDSKIYK